jgi:hypothetical protein
MIRIRRMCTDLISENPSDPCSITAFLGLCLYGATDLPTLK